MSQNKAIFFEKSIITDLVAKQNNVIKAKRNDCKTVKQNNNHCLGNTERFQFLDVCHEAKIKTIKEMQRKY